MVGVDRSDPLVNVTVSCFDMEVFSGKEPIPLTSCAPFASEKCAGEKSSTWVLQKLKEICHHVGLSCEGFKEELMPCLWPLKQAITRSQILVLNWLIKKVEN